MVSKLVEDKLLSLNDETIHNLKLSKRIKHPGEGGRARENVIAHFLESLVPSTFSVSTGFIMDALGNISPQIDIIIARRGYHPVIELGGIRHFMLESVHAVIENKARIDSVGVLTEALEKIRSVRAMDRTNRGRNSTVLGAGQKGEEVDSGNFAHQVMGGIITEKSLSSNRFLEEMKSFRNSHPRSVWPSFYADVEHFTALYMTNGVSGRPKATFDPGLAENFYVTDPEMPKFGPPLIEVGLMVLSFLRIVPIIDYSPTDYILYASGSGTLSEL